MSPQEAPHPARSLEIRVTEDGARTHIRVDGYEGGEFRFFRASRQRDTAFTQGDLETLVARIHTAIGHVLSDFPLW